MRKDSEDRANDHIRNTAKEAAAPGGLSAMSIERFLRSGEETSERHEVRPHPPRGTGPSHG